MVRPRIIETNEGIQNEITVTMFDDMSRRMRDKGWMFTDAVIAHGIDGGRVLEIGPGPGYLGLEWLRKCRNNGRLTALEISPAMIETAQKNAVEYGLADKVEYVMGNALRMPFPDAAFDGVMSSGSLHEWEDPAAVFGEIYRILRPGGRFCLSDLRRDANPLIRGVLWLGTKPKAMRPGLVSSLNAAYTAAEIGELLRQSPLKKAAVSVSPFGLTIAGRKG